MAPAPWTNRLTNLCEILTDQFDSKQQAREVTKQAGLDWGDIDTDGPIRTVWFNVVDLARRCAMVRELVNTAVDRAPQSPTLRQAKDEQLDGVVSPTNIREAEWKSFAEGPHLEKIMGQQSTLLPISFLENGLKRAQSVVRITTTDNNGSTCYGSGMLLTGNWLLTNHHVLPTAERAATAVVEFNYELNAEGLSKAAVPFRLQPADGFRTSEQHDHTLVRFAGEPCAKWGGLTLKPAKAVVDTRVVIIQHPAGGPKQIGLSHNLVTYADENVVQYLTDTLPGSSGSPVFNENWEIVALHNSGGHLREPGSKQIVYRNAGIAIGRVLAGCSDLLGP